MIRFLDLKSITSLHADEIKEAVANVIDSGWYLRGEANKQFELDYARYIGTEYCVGVGNGLDALTLIYRAYMEMGVMAEGDEVIVPANTFIASILAITENGLKPFLVEPRMDTRSSYRTSYHPQDQKYPPRSSIWQMCLYGENRRIMCQI